MVYNSRPAKCRPFLYCPKSTWSTIDQEIINIINKNKMEKTLGGNRLGSGNRMKVQLHNYERSTHDLGYLWRSTMSAGTLVPFLCEVGLPGDTFDIHLDCDVKTHPTVGPLFGSFKVQLDVFQAPIRLYHGKLHNNALGIGLEMNKIKLPIIKYSVPIIDLNAPPEGLDIDNAHINPSCILAYLGLRGLGMAIAGAPDNYRTFNGTALLAYWDIYKNYYANKQEENGAVIHTAPVAGVQQVDAIDIDGNVLPQVGGGTASIPLVDFNTVITVSLLAAVNQPLDQIMIRTNVGDYPLNLLTTFNNSGGLLIVLNYDPTYLQQVPVYATEWYYIPPTQQALGPINVDFFPLSDIDRMREYILNNVQSAAAVDIFLANLQPYKKLEEESDIQRAVMGSQEGLAIKTYQSDLLNNWIQTDWIDGVNGISAVTAIDTTGGSFTIDTLNLSRKVYDMLNRIAVSGGTYDNWLDAVYTHDRYQRCETPMYMGGLIKELVFQEVVSNAEAGGGDTTAQPLGTLAGKGIMGHKHKGGNITVKVDEPSYILGIISLTPRIDYSQGNKWDVHLETMDDLHKPALDEIGFQELITEQMAWWDTRQDVTGAWIQNSAGKQPAWVNYMTNVNKVYGNFAIESNEMFMTLNRKYEANQLTQYAYEIKDLTTYIDPRHYNQIFAQTSLDAQNFWAQISVDITARRKMSAKLMPNL